MRGNRSRDTAPEVAVRSALHRLGLRFRKDLHIRIGGPRGGKASAARPAAARSRSAKKAAATRKRSASKRSTAAKKAARKP